VKDLFNDAPKVPVSGFDDFWEDVPYKVNKKAAQKAWKKLHPAQRTLAASKVIPFYDWFRKTYPTASPLHPSTYLNGERWQDETGDEKSEMTSDTAQAIRDGLQSTIPAVREHAQRLAEKAGIKA